MAAIDHAVHPTRFTGPADRSRPEPADAEPLRAPLFKSDALLQGHRAIEISHNGVLYRLQATRLGKLILTK